MLLNDRAFKLYILLNSVFLTCLLMAEVIGAKLISSFGFTLTLGVVPFPITFLVTDIINEFYGKKMAKFTSYLGMVMVFIAYILILIGLNIEATKDSPIDDVTFRKVFANSGMIILGSIIAYIIGQLLDIQVFHYIRKKTNGNYVWLRATGSTVISQLIDSFVVIFIAFGQILPVQKLTEISTTNFVYKLFIAISITPLIYLGHTLMEKYLGEKSIQMLKEAQEEG